MPEGIASICADDRRVGVPCASGKGEIGMGMFTFFGSFTYT